METILPHQAHRMNRTSKQSHVKNRKKQRQAQARATAEVVDIHGVKF